MFKKILITFVVAIITINIVPEIAYGVEQKTGLKIITITSYFKEKNNELDMAIPNVYFNEEVYLKLNNDINEWTKKIMDDFFKDYNINDHKYLKVSYNILQNDIKWLTIKINVLEIMGSSNNYFKIYHVDKMKEKIIILNDLFKNDGYKKVLEDNINKQIKNNNDYYLENIKIKDDQNFYFNHKGNIVIVFDQFEIGIGSLGSPEFEIDKSIYEEYLL